MPTIITNACKHDAHGLFCPAKSPLLFCSKLAVSMLMFAGATDWRKHDVAAKEQCDHLWRDCHQFHHNNSQRSASVIEWEKHGAVAKVQRGHLWRDGHQFHHNGGQHITHHIVEHDVRHQDLQGAEQHRLSAHV
eukprot:scaffold15410_cov21-Tisochrysis_lutea.AAC.3